MDTSLIQHLHRIKAYHDVIVLKQFKSKKNHVALIEIKNNQFVLKWFQSQNRDMMTSEVSFLQSLSSIIHVPTIRRIDAEQNLFIMEYIHGENLCDILNNDTVSFQEKKQNMTLLAQWFALFHKETKTRKGFSIKGDAHIRNFILSKNTIWGVDFEESRYGNPSEDIAEVCISLLMSDPYFTEQKRKLSTHFIQSYQRVVPWSLKQFDQKYPFILKKVLQRRNQSQNFNHLYQKSRDIIESISVDE